MKNAAKLLVDRLPKLQKSLAVLTKRDVLVGVPGETNSREEPGEGMNNASLAYIHENGAPAANIPARPFMQPGVDDAKKKIVHHFELAAKRAMTGDDAFVERGLHAAGMVTQSAMRKRINEGPPPALAKSTLAARKARGRQSTKPLVDTGQLRNSINYVIRKKDS